MNKRGPKKQTHCKRGHPRSPDNLAKNGNCLACKREFNLKWAEDNPEKVRKSVHMYYENNKEDANNRTKKWREENPERDRETGRNSKRKSTLSRYGLKPEDVSDTCQVCGRDNGKRFICIDHNHDTGEFRGFLCSRCNLVLGHVQDDPQLLEKLALYLREKV
jgi:hypothetical protein